MTPELINILKKRHFRLFLNNPKVNCGDGWFNVIDLMCFQLEKVNALTSIEEIKVRHGEMRTYLDDNDHITQTVLNCFQAVSARTCHACGKSVETPIVNEGIREAICSECLKTRQKKVEVMCPIENVLLKEPT